jgi:hypothetical protein
MIDFGPNWKWYQRTLAAEIRTRDRVVHRLVPRVVGLIDHLDVLEIFHAEGRFPAGRDHADREALLDAERIAVLRIGDEGVVHGLAIGMVWLKLQASPPSLTSHVPVDLTPTSFISTDSGTPVHSLQLVIPWMYCTGRPMFGLP